LKILVFGKSGQVGSELVARASDFGFDVHGASSRDVDIGSSEALRRYVEKVAPDIIVNAAAYTAVDKAETDIARASAVNAKAPEQMAEIADQRKIPLFHISSDYVYDGQKTTSYVETDQPNPLGVYGRSKAQGDKAVVTGVRQHIILRTSWVFGTIGQNFVRTMVRLASERPELRVVNDQFGGPTDAGSIANALLKIAQSYAASDKANSDFPWGIYHFSGQPDVSWYGFATAIMAELSAHNQPAAEVFPIPSAEYPTPAPRPKNSTLDCSKIEREFHISQSDWQIAMRHLVGVLLNGPKT
tara:strand:+ start:114809 stop:115708 length:900 start_codon:yes stop_codon:yes gene_type:complete